MLGIELVQSGLDDTIKDIREILESALGRDISKNKKDEAINRTLGAIDTVLNMIRVFEFDNNASDI
jgi:hypothetical protein